MTENKNLEEFMAKLVKDEKLLQELKEAATKDPEKGAYNFALEHSHGGFTEDEFGKCLKKVLDACATKMKEMDESELENVAGGRKHRNRRYDNKIADQSTPTIISLNTPANKDPGANSYSVEAENTKGKWNAITAGINSLGSAANIFQTIANMWATWMARKDAKAARKVEGATAMLKIEKYKAQLRNEYGYTDDQINEMLDQF